MAELEMTVIVKNKVAAEAAAEAMREEIDAGRAEIFTFEEFGAYLVKLMQPHLDKLSATIDAIKKAQGDEPEAEEEIADPEDIGDVIAEAALDSWHRKPPGPGPRKHVKKPDPPGLVTDEDLEFIDPPDPDSKGIIEAAKRTWRKGRGMFGGD